ncbi:MAG: polysaccharide biosynthesis protein [Alphaproteobacteria bacterium]|nr:polysaccharide biosynthesis protein [Alphaproteobacteria bacterium]
MKLLIQDILKKISPDGALLIFLKEEAPILGQDLFLLVASLYISLFLRLGENSFEFPSAAIGLNAFLYVLLGLSVFLSKHIYQTFWVIPEEIEKSSIVKSVTFITLLYIPLIFILPKAYALPSSTPFINWFVAIALLMAPRLLYPFYQSDLNPVEQDNSPSIQTEDIDLANFLERDPLSINEVAIRSLIKGKRILITGAGGTIGAALVKKISTFSPGHLCLVDYSESPLYAIGLELKELHPKIPCDSMLGDVVCRERIRHIISSFKPEIVFHAAALKQVPVIEENLSQAVLTNVIGAQNVAEACRDFKVRAMVLISTHEALNPTNTMGATKRLAECYCQSLDILERKKPNGTRYACVEFSNILGAEGSVVPLFKKQIEQGGPLTLTHGDMIRHFIPLDEAIALILQALTLTISQDVAPGKVFLLNMGDPIKIIDLAKWLISCAGLIIDQDIKIKFTGLRAGEKLIEDLPLGRFTPSAHPQLLLSSPRTMDHGFLMRAFHELEIVAKSQDKTSLTRLLQALLPEYKKEDGFSEAPLEEVG